MAERLLSAVLGEILSSKRAAGGAYPPTTVPEVRVVTQSLVAVTLVVMAEALQVAVAGAVGPLACLPVLEVQVLLQQAE